MIEVKALELRDRGTFIPMLAVKVQVDSDFQSQEDWLLRKSGWGRGQSGYYLFNSADDGSHFAVSCGDPEFLHSQSFPSDRTYTVAFTYVSSHWDEFQSGDVVDVQCILRETEFPVESDRVYES